MSGLITGNYLPKLSTEEAAEQVATVLAFVADQHSLTRLYELATQNDWETSRRPIRKIELISGHAGCLSLKSTKQGAENAWRRIWVESPQQASVSLDIQPIFDDSITVRSDQPVFVRQYNPTTESNWNPGLQVIEQNGELSRHLRSFKLSMDVSVEFTGYDPSELSVM